MRRNRSLAIWGDGGVGKGLAVALSEEFRTILVGPPGSGRGELELICSGAFAGRATVEKAESGDRVVADHCIVAVKAYDLSEVAGPAAISSAGPCVCVTNGMGLEREWGPSWRREVEPAVLTAGFRLEAPCQVETSSGRVIATEDGEAAGIFATSPIPLSLTGGIEAVRWGKWIVNSVINPLGAVCRLPNDRLLEAGLDGVVERMFEELLSAVPADLRADAGRQGLEMLRDLLRNSGNRCSMLQDLQAGRRTEIDHLTGLCRELSRADCPVCACVTAMLKALSAGG